MKPHSISRLERFISRNLIECPHSLFVELKKNGGIKVRFEVFYYLDLKDFVQVGNMTSYVCKIHLSMS